ncbi:hybrid sensor histidine kinase/response regulator [Pseudodesulfovibrio aespoeensis]|uniref:hybrid sensor histidine kinase/response regulator n=1 Tax=Pseudodesulfovibrio aespoeensis TaxID=182210 RepID=UPI00235732EF|nr:hybrid sensor histidine kinase/response regulator [Pseudodesulfovibrio aespoeensis]MCG2732217.1 ATP-binding protein [Pseudodesulfovibrio aespoeensis]
MRIQSRLAITSVFAGLIVVFASTIILSSSLTSRSVLHRHARTIMENIASYTIDKSQNHLIPARQAARLTRGLSRNNIVSSKDVESMVAYFYEQLYLHPQFSGIYFGSDQGEFIMASRYNLLEEGGYYTKLIRINDGVRSVEQIYKSAAGTLIRHQFDPTDAYDPRTRPWYQRAHRANDLTWTDPYIFYTAKKPGITTANPVYNSSGQFLGVIGVDIGIEELSTFISKLNVSENGRAFIMSQSGDIIAYPDVEKLKQEDGDDKTRLTRITELDDPVAREAFLSLGLPYDNLHLREPIFTTFTLAGEKYNAMFAPFTGAEWPWVIGIYMPEDDYLGSIKANRTVNILIALVAVVIALIIGLLVANKLSRAREMAESADEAKSQFLARMSHEIRTPMNAMLGAGELLAETSLNGDQRRYVSIYQSAGEHLRELVRDVLDLSRFESGRFRLEETPFSLRSAIDKACAVFTLEARNKGLDLRCCVDPDTPDRLVGDPTALRQVLVNLLGNSIKFTPQGSVSLGVRSVGAGHEADGQTCTLEFTVQDTGIGIPVDKQEVIFERFSQADGSTSRKYGGTGLGLSICRNLVTFMGGSIAVDSQPGEGTTLTFTVRLPLDQNTGFGDVLPAAQCRACDAASAKRILLVEDDERNRLLFTLFLKDIPHTLDTAENGEEALRKHFAAPYDLILMDIEMAGMDGYQTTQAIRARERKAGLPEVPIVAVTAHALIEAEDKSREHGCSGFLSKPVTKAGLRQAVAQHLGVSLDPVDQTG